MPSLQWIVNQKVIHHSVQRVVDTKGTKKMFLAYLLEPFLLRLLLELLFYLVNYTACVQQDKRSLIFL